jgi:NAD(P) transhydrogenase subunit alpha
VPKEVAPGERRVALVPDALRELAKHRLELRVETGAGAASGCPDAAYEAAGAKVMGDAASLYAIADLIVKVQAPHDDREADRLREGQALVSVLQPLVRGALVRRLAARRVTAFALDLMPRTTLAQTMDVLSSMASIAGYKAVLLAADSLPRFFPMLMTAAGTIKPARVLVLGAGVAGLQAIATSRRLGAVVEAFDVRAAAREQVESLGARFVELAGQADAQDARGYAREQTEDELARQRALLGERAAQADVVICTALVPGRRAPVLLGEAELRGMKPGSVVIDLAAESGGNCEVTLPGEIVRIGDVRVHGPVNLPASMPGDASRLFSRNVTSYLAHLCPEGELRLDQTDVLVRDPLVTHAGQITNARVRDAALAD